MAYREIEDVLIGRLPISNVDTKSEYNILQWGVRQGAEYDRYKKVLSK